MYVFLYVNVIYRERSGGEGRRGQRGRERAREKETLVD